MTAAGSAPAPGGGDNLDAEGHRDADRDLVGSILYARRPTR